VSKNLCTLEYTRLEYLSSAGMMKAYIMISNEITDVFAYVFSLSEMQIYVCISTLQDGVIASATPLLVYP